MSTALVGGSTQASLTIGATDRGEPAFLEPTGKFRVFVLGRNSNDTIDEVLMGIPTGATRFFEFEAIETPESMSAMSRALSYWTAASHQPGYF